MKKKKKEELPNKEDWILGDDGELAPEIVQRNRGNVNPVKEYLAARSFHNSEEGGCQGALAGSCSPDHADLLLVTHLKGDPL